jgi:hypothetical protein
MSQDSSTDFARIVIIGGNLSGYRKQEQNKTIYISLSYRNNMITSIMKRETEEDLLVERYSDFYSNGKLRLTGKIQYRDKQKYDGIAIGIWYLYDEDGTLIEISEYDYDDSLYEFTREDIADYFQNKYPDHSDPSLYVNDKLHYSIEKWPQYTVNGEIKKKARWLIVISVNYGSINRTIHIQLDAKTGEKLNEWTGRIEK